MITVLLYGHLRKKFGKFHRFDIRTPAEAIRALVANFPGFQQHLINIQNLATTFSSDENRGTKKHSHILRIM